MRLKSMKNKLSEKLKRDRTCYIPKWVKALKIDERTKFINTAIIEYISELNECNIENFNQMHIISVYTCDTTKNLINESLNQIPHVSYSELVRVAIVRKILNEVKKDER